MVVQKKKKKKKRWRRVIKVQKILTCTVVILVSGCCPNRVLSERQKELLVEFARTETLSDGSKVNNVETGQYHVL